MIASNTSYRPASSSARNNILSRHPSLRCTNVSARRLGSPDRSILRSSVDRSLYSSLVCPRKATANNSVELLFSKRDNYPGGREEARRSSSLCSKKSSGNFEDPPQRLCANVARDLLTNAKFIYDLVHGHIRSRTGSFFQWRCVDSIVGSWVNGGVVIVQNSKNECFGFRECAECHFPRALLRPSFFFQIFLLTTIPSYFRPLSTLLCSSSDRGRREKKSLEHESRTSFRCCVDELSLGRSIVTPNGFRLLFGSSRLVVNHRFRVGECLL